MSAAARPAYREVRPGLLIGGLSLLVLILTIVSVITGRGAVTGGLGDLIA